MPIDEYVERRSLAIAVKIGHKRKACPRCTGQFSLTSDIVMDRCIRFVLYCPACGWWLALLERMPSDYRNEFPTSSNDWPPPLTTPPISA